jgi:hypothetical protein
MDETEPRSLTDGEQRVERDFVQRFAATRGGVRKSPVDVPWLVRSIIEGIGGNAEVPDQPTLEKAAQSLAEKFTGWPTAGRWIECLKAVIGNKPLRKKLRPEDWRWKPSNGKTDPKPFGVSEAEWQAAHDRQERAAVHFLKNDIAGQALVRQAVDEDWLVALADFVVEHGRLPDPKEERRCKALAHASVEELAGLGVDELQAQQRLIERVSAGERIPRGEPGAVALSSGSLRKLRQTMRERWARSLAP